jgi:hypothetical protein
MGEDDYEPFLSGECSYHEPGVQAEGTTGCEKAFMSWETWLSRNWFGHSSKKQDRFYEF